MLCGNISHQCFAIIFTTNALGCNLVYCLFSLICTILLWSYNFSNFGFIFICYWTKCKEPKNYLHALLCYCVTIRSMSHTIMFLARAYCSRLYNYSPHFFQFYFFLWKPLIFNHCQPLIRTEVEILACVSVLIWFCKNGMTFYPWSSENLMPLYFSWWKTIAFRFVWLK